MIRFCIALFVLAVVLAVIDADPASSEEQISAQSREESSNSDAPDLDEPLFDFPISRALGMQVRPYADRPGPQPGIEHLATSSDSGDTVEAAAAPVVYFDAPAASESSRSIWR